MIDAQGVRPLYAPIPRLDVSELPKERFLAEFARRRQPVIIEGLGALITGSRPGANARGGGHGETWGTNYWRRECGSRHVRPSRYQKGAKAWGGWVHRRGAAPMTLARFMETTRSSGEYVGDFGLPLGCPGGSWRANWTVPAFFQPNYFELLGGGGGGGGGGRGGRGAGEAGEEDERWDSSERDPPAESWPSLFIGGKGTQTGLHRDYGASHFWMLTVEVSLCLSVARADGNTGQPLLLCPHLYM
eukprot:SAG22_NODE_103_length_20175_cov_15.280833_3_plen_245_part_00